MKKLMSRFSVLAVLLGCLGLITVLDFRVNADPYCPEFCHQNCHAAYYECVLGCDDEDCVRKCDSQHNACIGYCNWVCGPE
jgi:hypothetical protein